MSGGRAQFVFVLLAGAVCLAATSPGPATRHHAAAKHTLKQVPVTPDPAPVPPPPPQILAPLTLEQIPALPPEVSYRDDELTITTQNSTLGDVLRAVRAQTHAAVDVPGNATERVVGHFGPGPAREVLAELLNGSHFNYVLLGSAANPSGLERVVLIPKSPSAPDASQAAPQSNRPPNGLYAGSPADMADDQPDDNEPDIQPDQGAQPVAPLDQPPANRPALKTPEQLLQELRQQQIQQQQAGAQDSSAQTPPQQR